MAKYPSYYVRPDGLHESIIRINGKRKAFRGKTDKEVWEKIKAFDRTAAEKEAAAASTFSAAAEAWWAEIEPTLQHNTAKSYKPAYERAKAEFGPRSVANITAQQIDEYIRDFASTRARKTVVTQLQIIRQILRKAEVDGKLKYNPASAVTPPRNLPRSRREAPDKEQIQRIKAGIKLPFGLFAALIYYTGCRRGEALALTGADIDRKNNLIYIRKSVYYMGNSPHIKEPKTEKGIRTVPLLDALAAALPRKLPKGYLFAGTDGRPLTDSQFKVMYREDKAVSGVTVTPHQIRHGYATALFESGIDPKTAQALLGHAQLSTTMDIYTHVYADKLKAAAEQMNKTF